MFITERLKQVLQRNHSASVAQTEELAGVVCMNCQSIIPADTIHAHSLACTIPVEHKTELGLVTQRLQKFLGFLTSAAQTFPTSDQRVVGMLQNNLADLAKAQLDGINSILNLLKGLQSRYSGSTNVKICIERGCAIANEFLEAWQLTTSNATVESLKGKIQKFGEHTEKKGCNECPQIHILPLVDIHSELSSNIQEASSYYSAPDALEESKHLPPDEIEDKQKHFYSLCLSEKLTLPSDSPAQTVDVASLYHEAENLPVEAWSGFIAERLRREMSASQEPSRVSRPARRRLNFLEGMSQQERLDPTI